MLNSTAMRQSILALLISTAMASTASAQTTYVTEGGVTYRETRRRVVQPIYETAYVQQAPLTYPQPVQTELREQIQTKWVPETRYQARTTWRPVAGFFSPRVPVQECVPVTVWRPQTQSVQVPVAVQTMSPVSVPIAPVATQAVRYEQREVVTRTPVGPLGYFASRTANNGSLPPWRLGWHPFQGLAWMRQPAAPAATTPYVYPTYSPITAQPQTYAATPVSYSASATPTWRASTR
jgi:hypothetical protein